MSSSPAHAHAHPRGTPAQPAVRGLHSGPWTALAAAAFLAIAAILHVAAPADGDGAAYVLQAAAGTPWERTIHVGYLLPLTAWVQALSGLGISPLIAAHGLAVLVGLWILALLARGGTAHDPRGRWLAPALFLAAALPWRGLLFAEVYAPLLLALLLAGDALRRRRDGLAAAALAWALLIHPGGLGLVPAVLVLSGRTPATSLRVLLGALGLAAAALLPLHADWLHGGRGVLALPAFDLGPQNSFARSWSVVAHDAGLAALPFALGLAARGPRAVAGAALVVLGASLSVDRYADNHAPLVVLGLLAPLAGAAPQALDRLPRRRLLTGVLAVVLLLGIADAALRHHAWAQQRLADAGAIDCDRDYDDWSTQQRAALLCR